ncbi:Acetamidase/formamidase [Sulfobacillus thermosulfidooxidans DSM 9293]|uniref:Acetamidase/formamidase n=1 Tax=Sulfobacillus thermosulfidooxidans (strain DSM 9293 / VKM B-1269 / AT-1) TaxID=929705 RepID=A0A1W1WG01_SULTA|nr:acetamidase/formamidase family protein [Sulfobacillus thermosulfidooxidans]SMC04980.1 Acetamidase/formamidase [Sulfobacillus thermosulfidooxidans DSM 9293]
MLSFHLSKSQAHLVWNNHLEPVLHVPNHATIEVEITNASGGQLSPTSQTEDVRQLDFSRVNPVTGPIYIDDAEPGDTLVVDILAVDVDNWGWTANIPGFGLLQDMFPHPHLRISQITDQYAELLPGLRIPVQPFIGTIGVALPQDGDHSLVPPRAQGGNMDIRHLVAGSRLYLPVAVKGALLSLGDTHAAQGDGEVAGTAIETNAMVTIRVHLEKNFSVTLPQLETPPHSQRHGHAWVTTGIGPDLFEAARQATRHMVSLICHRTGLPAIDAYLLTSVAADLKIAEIVDVPNWVVTMHLEKQIIDGGI